MRGGGLVFGCDSIVESRFEGGRRGEMPIVELIAGSLEKMNRVVGCLSVR